MRKILLVLVTLLIVAGPVLANSSQEETKTPIRLIMVDMHNIEFMYEKPDGTTGILNINFTKLGNKYTIRFIGPPAIRSSHNPELASEIIWQGDKVKEILLNRDDLRNAMSAD